MNEVNFTHKKSFMSDINKIEKTKKQSSKNGRNKKMSKISITNDLSAKGQIKHNEIDNFLNQSFILQNLNTNSLNFNEKIQRIISKKKTIDEAGDNHLKNILSNELSKVFNSNRNISTDKTGKGKKNFNDYFIDDELFSDKSLNVQLNHSFKNFVEKTNLAEINHENKIIAIDNDRCYEINVNRKINKTEKILPRVNDHIQLEINKKEKELCKHYNKIYNINSGVGSIKKTKRALENAQDLLPDKLLSISDNPISNNTKKNDLYYNFIKVKDENLKKIIERDNNYCRSKENEFSQKKENKRNLSSIQLSRNESIPVKKPPRKFILDKMYLPHSVSFVDKKLKFVNLFPKLKEDSIYKLKVTPLQENISDKILLIDKNNLADCAKKPSFNLSKKSNDIPININLEEEIDKHLMRSEEEEDQKKIRRDFFVMKRVYDSLSEDEDDKKKKPNTFYFNPHSLTKLIIDLFIFFISIYTIIFIPLRLVCLNEASLTSLIIEIFSDFIMILDLILGFFTAYYDFEENYITSFENMIVNYLKSYFFIDLFAALPLNSFLEFDLFFREDKNFSYIHLLDKNYMFEDKISNLRNYEKDYFLKQGLLNDPSHSIDLGFKNYLMNNYLFDMSYDKLFYLNYMQSCKILKIIRIFKVFKTFSKNEFIKRIYEYFRLNTSIYKTNIKILSYYIYFFFISHVLSCIFVFFGTVDYPNWIVKTNLQNFYFGEIYLASLYFNHTTIFTVGYGDIISKNVYERIYNVILMIVGIMLYSFALTSISNIVKINDEKTKNYDKKREYLDHISMKYLINKQLYDKLLRHLSYDMKTDKSNKLDFLNELPITLRNEMILNMNRRIINSFNFFKNCYDNDFMIQVIITLKPTTSVRNDILIKQGDMIEEIIFVKYGILQLETFIKFEEEKETQNNHEIDHRDNSGHNAHFPHFNVNRNTTHTNNDEEKENEEDFDEEQSNKKNSFEKIKILELRRNEHFGDSLMIDNIRSPLNLRTKSKTAELFLMNKLDVMRLSEEYSGIFEKIYNKSSYNFSQILLKIERVKKERLVLKFKTFMKNKEAKNEFSEEAYLNSNNNDDINETGDNLISKVKNDNLLKRSPSKFYNNAQKKSIKEEILITENDDIDISKLKIIDKNYQKLNRVESLKHNEDVFHPNNKLNIISEDNNSGFIDAVNIHDLVIGDKLKKLCTRNTQESINNLLNERLINSSQLMTSSKHLNKSQILKCNDSINLYKASPDEKMNDDSCIRNIFETDISKINTLKNINEKAGMKKNDKNYDLEKIPDEISSTNTHHKIYNNNILNIIPHILIKKRFSEKDDYLYAINNEKSNKNAIYLNNGVLFSLNNKIFSNSFHEKREDRIETFQQNKNNNYFNRNSNQKFSKYMNTSSFYADNLKRISNENLSSKKKEFLDDYGDKDNYRDDNQNQNNFMYKIKSKILFPNYNNINDSLSCESFEKSYYNKDASHHNSCFLVENNSRETSNNNIKTHKNKIYRESFFDENDKKVTFSKLKSKRKYENMDSQIKEFLFKTNVQLRDSNRFNSIIQDEFISNFYLNQLSFYNPISPKNKINNEVILCDRCNNFITENLNRIKKKIFDISNDNYSIENTTSLSIISSTQEDSSIEKISSKKKYKKDININNIQINNNNFPIIYNNYANNIELSQKRNADLNIVHINKIQNKLKNKNYRNYSNDKEISKDKNNVLIKDYAHFLNEIENNVKYKRPYMSNSKEPSSKDTSKLSGKYVACSDAAIKTKEVSKTSRITKLSKSSRHRSSLIHKVATKNIINSIIKNNENDIFNSKSNSNSKFKDLSNILLKTKTKKLLKNLTSTNLLNVTTKIIKSKQNSYIEDEKRKEIDINNLCLKNNFAKEESNNKFNILSNILGINNKKTKKQHFVNNGELTRFITSKNFNGKRKSILKSRKKISKLERKATLNSPELEILYKDDKVRTNNILNFRAEDENNSGYFSSSEYTETRKVSKIFRTERNIAKRDKDNKKYKILDCPSNKKISMDNIFSGSLKNLNGNSGELLLSQNFKMNKNLKNINNSTRKKENKFETTNDGYNNKFQEFKNRKYSLIGTNLFLNVVQKISPTKNKQKEEKLRINQRQEKNNLYRNYKNKLNLNENTLNKKLDKIYDLLVK